jgi:hypothetical protein
MVLMVTMIIGVITVVAVFVTRMPQFGASPPVLPVLPAAITLPQGADPQAVTFGDGWVAVVTRENRILVYDSDGILQQDVPLLGGN